MVFRRNYLHLHKGAIGSLFLYRRTGMGLFSSKKKTTVHTSVIRAIEDTQIPDSAKAGVLKAIVRDENISEHLVDSMVESMVFKAERMYEYAAKNYYYGVPKRSISTDMDGQDVVERVIENETGRNITIDYFKYAPINSLHVGWKVLVGQYGYDEQSNVIQVISGKLGTPAFLKDMVPVYVRDSVSEAELGALNKWGKSPKSGYTPEREASAGSFIGGLTQFSPDIISDTALSDHLLVTYVFEEITTKEMGGYTYNESSIREGTFTIPIDGYEEDMEYFHVKYYYQDSGGVRKADYWTYLDDSGVYPEIDSIHGIEYDQVGTHFPIIYFRHDKKDRAAKEYRGTRAFKTTERVLKYLGIDFIDMSRNIHENPDVGDIEQAFLMFGVPAQTSNQIELEYLFEYFMLLHGLGGSTPTSTQFLNGAVSSKSGRAIRIHDAEFDMTLSFSTVSRRRRAGRIGKVGRYAGGRGKDVIKQEFQGEYGLEILTQENPYLYYRKQLSTSLYEEIRVYNPRMTYHVWSKYNTVAKIGNENLLIPIDRSITGVMGMPSRETLYARSLHFVFNTRVTTKEKWYQSGWFKVVMVIVAVVLTILYPPGGAAMWASIAAMGTAVYIAAIILVVAIQGFVVEAVMKLVAKALGPEVALLLAVVAIAYAGGRGLQQGLTAMQKMAADVILKLGTNLAKTAYNQHTAAKLDEYLKDQSEFDLMSDKLTAELEEIKKALDVSVDLNPFEFIGEEPMLILAEKPGDLYQRTVHSGNIGLVSMDAIKHYVDLSLKLPDFVDTMTEEEGELA